MKRLLISVLAGICLIIAAVSCEEETLTIGEGVIGGEPFGTGTAYYDVFAYNHQINAVPTNRLPLYQLGVFNDPIYGRTESRITAQLNLPNSSGNPVFGIYSQAEEDSDPDATQENETVTRVRLFLPFFLDNSADSDSDGVIDELDEEPNNSTNDSDGDGLSNAQETAGGTNPLNPDTDGDGTPDGSDTSTPVNTYPNVRKLDSIYGNRDQPFTLKIERNTFFLSDLDPGSNFQDSRPYFSDQQISPDFVSDVLFEDQLTISNEETLIFNEDDPDTEEDESLTLSERLPPGIVVYLDPDYFQENLIDKEGGPELLSNLNFREFFRGLHLSLTPAQNEELMILLDLTRAQLQVSYQYRQAGQTDPEESTFTLRLLTGGGNQAISGNAINTQLSEAYPATIADALVAQDPASRIYLKGGAGTYAELDLFDQLGGGEIINEIKQNNWLINAAYLVFHVDRETLDNAGGTVEPPRLYVYNSETNAPLYNRLTENSTAETSFGVYQNYDGFLEKEGDLGMSYRVNITEHINNIIIRDSANARLGLTLTPDLRLSGTQELMVPPSDGSLKELPVSGSITPLGTVLYGGDASIGLANRLRLEIRYTEIDP
ncbi:DUF4270 domain-containing protein [Robiginitalea sp. SC105]|uniref:DUF4270 domain-containing protein n=1 Tax=Robiginitalea sp. SC105 TaxID=2762332 RepID=UPI00163A258A|nr:DUF4270 domain-containing protein [Robiginitalea sp. SC105]MBC2837980.1 DUF4270 family protein [Robiginitalea sp. SC105]